jgi:hypothetical protein
MADGLLVRISLRSQPGIEPPAYLFETSIPVASTIALPPGGRGGLHIAYRFEPLVVVPPSKNECTPSTD